MSRYDGTACRALTLEGKAASLHSPGRGPVAPSQRYLGLLRDGTCGGGLRTGGILQLGSWVCGSGVRLVLLMREIRNEKVSSGRLAGGRRIGWSLARHAVFACVYHL